MRGCNKIVNDINCKVSMTVYNSSCYTECLFALFLGSIDVIDKYMYLHILYERNMTPLLPKKGSLD